MKVVILAGGFGSRLLEHTKTIPKPMVEVGGKPLLWHIMRNYAHYGFKEFVIALGYKKEAVKNYFLNFYDLNSDFTINLSTGKEVIHGMNSVDWDVTLIDTGLNSMTGGRIKRLAKYLNPNEPFFLTYGDGLANVDIPATLAFHKKHKRLATMTAVHPPPRFGTLNIEDNRATDFVEKSGLAAGWINGGYFVLDPKVLDYIKGDATVFEQEPLQTLATQGDLMAYQHEGFWHCVDNASDLSKMEEMYQKSAPWILGNKNV